MARKNKIAMPATPPLHLVEFRRHIVAPVRRCIGDRVWLTDEQIQQQQLSPEDYHVIEQPKPAQPVKETPKPNPAAPGTVTDRMIRSPRR